MPNARSRRAIVNELGASRPTNTRALASIRLRPSFLASSRSAARWQERS